MSAGKRKRKKQNKLQKNRGKAIPSRIDQLLKNWFKDRAPIAKFLLGFLFCMSIFYLFYHSSLYKSSLELPLLNFQANIGSSFLNLLGYATTVQETIISGNGFSVNIKSGCDGLEALALLLSGILIFPTPFKLKVPGLVWGILILSILNLLRIAGLYLAGYHFSEVAFDIFHIQGGFILFTMISVLIWMIWMNWSLKKIQTNSAI